MITASKNKKTCNLVASVLVTAALIVAWHFAVPQFETITNTVKYVSYAILLFGMTWILDALFAFAKGKEDLPPAERVVRMQTTRALVGMVAYLLYAALSHAVVAVLFANGQKILAFPFASAEKDGLAFVGFCLFLAGPLSLLKSRKGLCAAYILPPLVALAFSFAPISMNWGIGVMAALTVLLFYVDALQAYKTTGVSANAYVLRQIVYLALLAAVMVLRYFTPVNSGNNVAQFAFSGLINLAIAVVLDIIIAFVGGGKSKGEKQPASVEVVRQPQQTPAGAAK